MRHNMTIYQFEVNRGQLDAAYRCVLLAAKMAYNRRDEIDFYCPEETRFLSCIAAMLQRFRCQLEQEQGEDLLEFDCAERQALSEVLSVEIEINNDLIVDNSSCPETLRSLAYQWELFDIIMGRAAA